jgi:chemotaxis signal transduction protein
VKNLNATATQHARAAERAIACTEGDGLASPNASTDTRRSLLAFDAAGTSYAVSTTSVSEIIQHCPIKPIADAPPFVLGVITLRHEVIPIVDIGVLLDNESSDCTGSRTCFVITNLQTSQSRIRLVALVADRVHDTFRVESDRIDPPPSIASREQADYVAGFVRTDAGVKILIDVGRLFANDGDRACILGELEHCDTSDDGTFLARPDDNSDRNSGPTEPARIKLLSVIVAGMEYAFPIREVYRAIPVDTIERDSLAPTIVCGCMNMAGERLGLVNLYTLLGLPDDHERKPPTTVVVANHDGVLVGYLVDSLGELYDVDQQELRSYGALDDVAAATSRGLGFLEISDGAIEVISFSKMVAPEEIHAINNWKQTQERLTQLDDLSRNGVPDRKEENDPNLKQHAGTYLVINVGGFLMAIDAKDTEEVVPFESIVRVPRAKHDFAGVLLLRDRTYPVLDLCRHFAPRL